MTKHEIETLKKGYQRKCMIARGRRNANPEGEAYAEAYAEAESERIGYLYAAMKLMEVGKRQGSSRHIIDEWEAEIGFVDEA